MSQSHQSVAVSRFFSDFAGTWDTLYGGKRTFFWRLFDHVYRRDIYERYVLTFEHLGADLTGKTVLDVGCGSGLYCIEAAKRGATGVLGIDIADNMVELARQRSAEAGTQQACRFVATSFPLAGPSDRIQEMFDYGIVMGVMDYVPDATAFLVSLRPLLQKFAVLSFPGKHWIRAPIRKWRYRLLGRCEIYGYDDVSIREACRIAGFRTVDITRLDHSGICYIVTAHV